MDAFSIRQRQRLSALHGRTSVFCVACGACLALFVAASAGATLLTILTVGVGVGDDQVLDDSPLETATKEVNASAVFLEAVDEIFGRPWPLHGNAVRRAFLSGNCRRMPHRHARQRLVGAGWTKEVVAVEANDGRGGRELALKRPRLDGRDFLECLRGGRRAPSVCYRKLLRKFFRELAYLLLLRHRPGVVHLKAWCVTDDEASIVTELGDSTNIVELLQMAWEQRLRLSLSLSRLLSSLHSSPVGPLALRDFRRDQFVIVDGELRLADLDDLDFQQPACSSQRGLCTETVDRNFKLSSRCSDWRCSNVHNDRLNVYRARSHFPSFLLLHSAPTWFRGSVRQLLTAAEKGDGSRQLAGRLETLARVYGSGAYWRGGRTGISLRPVHNATLVGGDFACPVGHRLSGRFSGQCVLSACDASEAVWLCNREPKCAGFVSTGLRSWTNRTMIVLKSSKAKLRASGAGQVAFVMRLPNSSA